MNGKRNTMEFLQRGGEYSLVRLTPERREAIIRRRGCKSDGDGKRHNISNLEIHHRDRDPGNNGSRNLRVLTKKEHDELHSRYG